MSVNKVELVLNGFSSIFKKNPFDYLYESDIQAILYSQLKDNFNSSKALCDFESLKHYKISKVRTNYHPNSKIFLDIAILERADIIQDKRLHDRPEDKDEMFLYWQKVDIAIEIKFQVINTDQTKNFKDDLNKLKMLKNKLVEEECINTGIGILFFQKSKDFEKIKEVEYSEYKMTNVFEIKENAINAYVVTPSTIYYYRL